ALSTRQLRRARDQQAAVAPPLAMWVNIEFVEFDRFWRAGKPVRREPRQQLADQQFVPPHVTARELGADERRIVALLQPVVYLRRCDDAGVMVIPDLGCERRYLLDIIRR